MTPRCYVPAAAWTEQSVVLSPEPSQHLARVLRMQPGDVVELFNGAGEAAVAEITKTTKRAVTVRVGSRRCDPRPQPHITLMQSLIRPQRMDYVLQKATELGVTVVQPVMTERCVARTRERPERWMKTVISAAEQCGANWLPDIRSARDYTEVAGLMSDYDRVLVCALTADAWPLKEVLRAPAQVERVAAWIGPEGDFTSDEMRVLVDAGAVPVSLGTLTLRAETAALFVLSALRYEWG